MDNARRKRRTRGWGDEKEVGMRKEGSRVKPEGSAKKEKEREEEHDE